MLGPESIHESPAHLQPSDGDNFIDDLPRTPKAPEAEVPHLDDATKILEAGGTVAATLNLPPAEHDTFVDDLPAKPTSATEISPAEVPHLEDLAKSVVPVNVKANIVAIHGTERAAEERAHAA
jgi:hypothetical protein